MQRVLSITYEELTIEGLSPAERTLLQAAREAARQAYAPYSDFPVGAAVRLRDGRIFTGNNQENAAYPSGLCAERTVLFYVGSQGLISEVEMLGVYAPKLEAPVMPCGACRQVMYEYERLTPSPWTLIFAGSGEIIYRLTGVENLLPLAFVWRLG